MSVEKRNVLTLLENGQLKTYLLDDQLSWEVGRESINSNPDIKLRSTTVSRRHGKFTTTVKTARFIITKRLKRDLKEK